MSKILEIYKRREALVLALSYKYAAIAEKLFQDMQKNNEEFWNNQTFQAADNVFGDAYKTPNFVGFFLAHGKDYGVYLELANNRQNEALRPIINSLYEKFTKELKEIYGAN